MRLKTMTAAGAAFVCALLFPASSTLAAGPPPSFTAVATVSPASGGFCGVTATASWKHVAALVSEVDEGVFDNGVGVGGSTDFISPPKRAGSATFGPHQIAIGVSEFVLATYKSPGGGTAGTATSNTVTCS